MPSNAVALAQGASNNVTFRNRIINGAMVIDQRNAGASVSGTTGVYTLDRWSVQNNSGSARFNVQQNVNSVTPPAGYKYYLGVTSTSAYSVVANDIIAIQQFIEGYNIADLAWGTASATTVTLSFWVRSSLTGTFGGSVVEGAAGGALYPFSYTISAANTWEQKSVTIVGPSIGTWNSTNGKGIQLLFSMGTGSNFTGTAGSWTASSYYAPTGATSVVGTNAATWYVTGVQLEKGSTATSFDYRPYTTELALCQRYLPAFTAISGTNGPLQGMATALTTNVNLIFNHPVPARVPGTGVAYSANTHFTFSNNDGNSASTAVSFAAGSPNASQLSITVASSRGVVTTPGWIYANNASAILYITGCEL